MLKHTKFTDFQKQEIIELYNQGIPVKEISKKLDYKYNIILRNIKKWGLLSYYKSSKIVFGAILAGKTIFPF
jgi:hypothetical protein